MRLLKTILACLAAASLLAACGSGDKVQFRYVVSFGDSVSDAGTYKVGTIAALGGGQFTVNGPTAKTWTQILSDLVHQREPGWPRQCAAQTGMLPNNGATGAPVTDFPNCFNYAQGSSRVSSSGTGPNGVGLQAYGDSNLGFMADSLLEQMNRHLARVGGSYSDADLVTVNAGGNDVFMQLNAVGAAAAGGQVAAGAAQIAGWSPSVIAEVSAGGPQAVLAASTAAVVGMGQAGAELAGYIKTLIVAKGAKYVLVRNLGDLNVTPYGRALDPATQGLITAAVEAFNGQLQAGLAGTPGVQIYDDYALTRAIAANPAAYGYSNAENASCGTNAFGGPIGPTIVCNASNLIAGDTSKYAYSDDVHPTPFAHLKTAETALELMKSIGWQ